MAVIEYINDQRVVSYVGCVIYKWEHNGYHDSDFYAACWDEEKQEVVSVEYDSTRYGGGGGAICDLTLDNLRKVYRYYYNEGRIHFDGSTKINDAKTVNKGDLVEVFRGTKVPKGTRGKVFWIGQTYNPYSHKSEGRVGIETEDGKVFLPLAYVLPVDWEKRIVTGKDRKRKLRNYALRSLPVYCREMIYEMEKEYSR